MTQYLHIPLSISFSKDSSKNCFNFYLIPICAPLFEVFPLCKRNFLLQEIFHIFSFPIFPISVVKIVVFTHSRNRWLQNRDEIRYFDFVRDVTNPKWSSRFSSFEFGTGILVQLARILLQYFGIGNIGSGEGSSCCRLLPSKCASIKYGSMKQAGTDCILILKCMKS